MRISDWSSDVCSSDLSNADGRWVPAQGDGTYRNPVLAGDYSGPDVVRAGQDFYLTASSFTDVPGLPILHSRDLVNWTLIGHALPHVPPEDHYRTPRRGGGIWAPAIRYRGGKFLIYYPDPDRSEEHTSDLQSLMRTSYAVFGSKKKNMM